MSFVDVGTLDPRSPLPGGEGRFLHSPRLTFAYHRAEAGPAG